MYVAVTVTSAGDSIARSRPPEAATSVAYKIAASARPSYTAAATASTLCALRHHVVHRAAREAVAVDVVEAADQLAGIVAERDPRHFDDDADARLGESAGRAEPTVGRDGDDEVVGGERLARVRDAEVGQAAGLVRARGREDVGRLAREDRLCEHAGVRIPDVDERRPVVREEVERRAQRTGREDL